MSYDKALDYAYKILSYQDRSVKELRSKLRNKKFRKDEIDKVVAELSNLGYLNDEKYAEMWVKNKMKNRPCGRILMIKGLMTKGIKKEIIENVLKKFLTEEKELEMARKLAEKKLRSINCRQNSQISFSKKKKYEKIGRFLQSRGFNERIILHILEGVFLNNCKISRD